MRDTATAIIRTPHENSGAQGNPASTPKEEAKMTEGYSRPKPKPFPRALAASIARKASIMASELEDKAIRQMVREAQRALDRGDTTASIEQQLGLK